MTLSYTLTESETFTIMHAGHIAARVVTDLKRMQRFYGRPSDAEIADFESELVQLLKEGYLASITYGFQRNGSWIEPTLVYTARNLAGGTASDDDPGRIQPGADIRNAFFRSYLRSSAKWFQLSVGAKEAFEKLLPFQRSDAAEPSVTGYLSSDRTYSAGGRALDRASVRSY